jgi:hypothetical protein
MPEKRTRIFNQLLFSLLAPFAFLFPGETAILLIAVFSNGLKCLREKQSMSGDSERARSELDFRFFADDEGVTGKELLSCLSDYRRRAVEGLAAAGRNFQEFA